MAPRRPPASWWELLLPAGLWFACAELALAIVRASLRGGPRSPRTTVFLMRLATRLSRAGVNAWRANGRQR